MYRRFKNVTVADVKPAFLLWLLLIVSFSQVDWRPSLDLGLDAAQHRAHASNSASLSSLNIRSKCLDSSCLIASLLSIAVLFIMSRLAFCFVVSRLKRLVNIQLRCFSALAVRTFSPDCELINICRIRG